MYRWLYKYRKAALILIALCWPDLGIAAGRGTGAVAPVGQSLGQTLSGNSKKAYESGKMLFESGDPAAALVKFNEAYALQGDPRLLWNMAACERVLRRYKRVRTLTLEFVERASRGGLLTEVDQQQASALLETLKALIGKVRLDLSPDTAVAKVDEVEEAGRIIELDVGRHMIVVQAEGYRSQTTQYQVTGGEAEAVLKIRLEPSTATLTVTTNVEEALIAVDGVSKSSAHWTGHVAPGHRLIRVSAEGYLTRELDLSLDDRENRNLTVTLQKAGSSRAAFWLVAGAAAAVGAGLGSYFVLRPSQDAVISGDLGYVQLPLVTRGY